MLLNYLRKLDRISEKGYKRVKTIVLATGMITLAVGLIINRFTGDNGILAFFSGFLIGLSIVANIAGIILHRPLCKN